MSGVPSEGFPISCPASVITEAHGETGPPAPVSLSECSEPCFSPHLCSLGEEYTLVCYATELSAVFVTAALLSLT